MTPKTIGTIIIDTTREQMWGRIHRIQHDEEDIVKLGADNRYK